MKKPICWFVLSFSPVFIAACSDGNHSGAEEPVAPEEVIAAPPLDCDPLTPSYCGFPYPNDYWTEQDSGTVTGLRLALPQVIMPANTAGVRSSPDAFNEMDGFSAGYRGDDAPAGGNRHRSRHARHHRRPPFCRSRPP